MAYIFKVCVWGREFSTISNTRDTMFLPLPPSPLCRIISLLLLSLHLAVDCGLVSAGSKKRDWNPQIKGPKKKKRSSHSFFQKNVKEKRLFHPEHRRWIDEWCSAPWLADCKSLHSRQALQWQLKVQPERKNEKQKKQYINYSVVPLSYTYKSHKAWFICLFCTFRIKLLATLELLQFVP